MNDKSSHVIDYKTHILIGVTSNGRMAVIYHWPHVPRQAEVQRKIDAVQEGYATFLLCTPTSIMRNDVGHKQTSSPRPGQ
jgi:hypothetical protein